MDINELFDNRKLIALNLKNCLRDKGYTKVSFAEKINISRPTLDKLLNGEIENKKTFNKHLQKILDEIALTPSELVGYHYPRNQEIQAVNSENSPENYRRSSKAQSEFDLLLDIVDLCGIYY